MFHILHNTHLGGTRIFLSMSVMRGPEWGVNSKTVGTCGKLGSTQI